MAQTQTKAVYHDLDIEANIRHAMKKYPPLAHDSHNITFTVKNGKVKLSGYTKSAVTATYLLNTVSQLPGVKKLDAKKFYNDTIIRLQISKFVPGGVFASAEYGSVILSGDLPDEKELKAISKKMKKVGGVRNVVTAD
jgi:osmotically-inducible protein OsmY